MRFPRPALCLAVAAALSSGGGAVAEQAAAPAPALQLTLSQADAMAQAALQQGQARLAYDLSKGLLQADRHNEQAHYYQAVALAQADAWGAAGRAAARAYRHAKSDGQRYQAANLAARLSFAGDRFTASQFWLRRAVDHADGDVARAQTIRAFERVRRHNPLNFKLRFSVSPSDNVNNGATSPLNVIDGVPVVGVLSPGARALSGVVATTRMRGTYRVDAGEGHETRLKGRVTSRRVRLSDTVAGLSGGDLSSTVGEIGVSHYIVGGSEAVTWKLDLDGGRVWYGGDPLYDYARLGVRRHQKLAGRLTLSFGGYAEAQQDEADRGADSTVASAFAGLGWRLDGGARLGVKVQYRDTDSDGVNRASDQWTGIASYRMGRAVGPAELEFALGVSTLDFGRYSVGFIPVPGGRRDESVFASVTATFDDVSYMGFVPTLSVTTERSRSNVSRFDVDETSLTLGMRSEF